MAVGVKRAAGEADRAAARVNAVASRVNAAARGEAGGCSLLVVVGWRIRAGGSTRTSFHPMLGGEGARIRHVRADIHTNERARRLMGRSWLPLKDQDLRAFCQAFLTTITPMPA